jgi:uncharacterized cupredoxin-like copper-binding protein
LARQAQAEPTKVVGRDRLARSRDIVKRVALLVLAVLAVGACGGGSATTSSGGARKIEVKLTDEGCSPFDFTVAPGSTTFHITNDGANAVSEFYVYEGSSVLAERENITAGLDRELTVDLKQGTSYSVACPGGTKHATGTLTVSGAASSSAARSDHDAAACVPIDTSGATSHLAVGLKDFTITPAFSTAAAGKVAIDGTNSGTHPHEVVVVKGVAPADLPRAADGSIDEDQLPAGAKIGELEAFAPGGSCSSVLELTAGSYTLFCNVVGTSEGAHVKQGMVTPITVS